MAIVTYNLPAEYLRSVLRYEPETGFLYWIKPAQGRKLGQRAGSRRSGGYIHVSVDNRRYLAHRLAWTMYHGEIGDGVIDHINGDTGDNRIDNLRLVTFRENHHNRAEHRQGRLVGASRCSKVNKWQSRITVYGKQIDLGHFDTESQAHHVYLGAVKLLAKIEGEAA